MSLTEFLEANHDLIGKALLEGIYCGEDTSHSPFVPPVRHAPMEYFYRHAEEYVDFLHATRSPYAAKCLGADYRAADFLTMINGLMSLFGKRVCNGSRSQGEEVSIVVTTDGSNDGMEIASAAPVLTFTANQLIREGRGGSPQKRSIKKMQRLIADTANMALKGAQARGLYGPLINRAGGDDTIENVDPVTGAIRYRICLSRYFYGDVKFFWIIDDWGSYLQAKRAAKGLEAKANTYVTEADMRFVFYLRTLKSGEPNRISSEALAERIGKASQLNRDPKRFHADIKAMAEAAKTMETPLLSAYKPGEKWYSFVTVKQASAVML